MADASAGLPRRSAVVWVALSVLLAVHVGVVASILVADRPIIWPLHNDTIHRKGRGADFFAVYHAALSVRRGQDPYAIDPDGVTPYFFAFRYLPIVAIAAEPLTALQPQTAYVVWVMTLEALLAVFIVTLWRSLPDTGVRMAAVGLLLVNSPYFLELYMGQFTFVSAALCVLAFLLPAGPLYFAVSAVLKPFTLAALPALARERRYWWHLIVALVAVAGLSLPYFIRHPVQRNIFLDANFTPVGGLGIGNVGLVQWLSLVTADAGFPWGPGRLPIGVSALRFLVLGVTALVVWRGRSRPIVSGACALLLAHFLTYQQVWEHHMSAVMVLGTWLLTLDVRRQTRVTSLVIAALVLLALPTPFGWFDVAKDPSVFDPTGSWPRYAMYVVVLSKVVPTLLLFACAIAAVRREGLMPWRDAFRPSRISAAQ